MVTAAELWAIAHARPPTLGAGRLVCVDGPAGSGKTTLAGGLEAAGGHVVHMDDLFDGWQGLPRVDAQLASILRPLVAGRPGTYRRYDWEAEAYAEGVVVAPVPLLVLEGVGSGSRLVADLCTVLVWVEAPPDVRLARGLARDGEHMREHWLRWMTDEAVHHQEHGTRARADVVVWTG